MKITNIEIWDSNFDNLFTWNPVIIRINTDEGISGLGECGLAYGVGHSGGAGFIKNLAERFLIGADPMKTEKLWENMFRNTFWGQGGGPVVYGAMSAIDIACWDIRGKAMGQPIYQLLGGKTNDKLRTYASQLQFGWNNEKLLNMSKPEEYGEMALAAIEDGYDAVKVDFLQVGEDGVWAPPYARILSESTLRMVRNRLKAIRNAAGDDLDIIVELHCCTNVSSGIQIGKICEEYHCMFMEESVHYLNPKLQQKVSSSLNFPQAAGERLYTRWGYRQYLEDQSLGVIQPDLCLAGGITEGKKICDYANIYDVTTQLHVCGSPISTAAALQLEAVIPNFQIHEHHTIALKQFNRQICVQDYQPVKGQYSVPDLPGLGIELNEEVMAKQQVVIVK